MSGKQTFAPLAALMLAGLLSACTSNGPSSSGGSSSASSSSGGSSSGASSSGTSSGAGIISGSSSGGPANNGTGPTDITTGGTPGSSGSLGTPGTPVSGNFICTQSATAYGDVTTEVGANGLVGADLSSLLDSLSGSDVSTLLNSVINPNNVIDGNLSTYATMDLAVGLLGSVIDSVDLSVVLPSGSTVPAGQFAVFALSFPNGTVDLSLINAISVTTSLAGVPQENNTLDQTAVSLLGVGVSLPPAVYLGIKTTKPYDTATVSLTPVALSADVGNAMLIYEFCPGGTLVQ